MNSKDLQIISEFNSIKGRLEEWGAFVDSELTNNILPDLIQANLIKQLPDRRLKGDTSYLYKALYRRKPYTNPIVDIEDKIGTRVVVLKSDEIEIIADRVSNYHLWEAKLSKDIKQGIYEKPTSFDYQSVHFILKPKPDDSRFSDDIRNQISCELQIRTILQHAFAEVSHETVYKGEFQKDVDIIRRLAKSMAMMEVADEYFCEIFKIMEDEVRKFKNFMDELISLFGEFDKSFSHENLRA